MPHFVYLKSELLRRGLAVTMIYDRWSVVVLARRKVNAFFLLCSSTESELSGGRRVWLTVWHRPVQALTLACGEGFFGAC